MCSNLPFLHFIIKIIFSKKNEGRKIEEKEEEEEEEGGSSSSSRRSSSGFRGLRDTGLYFYGKRALLVYGLHRGVLKMMMRISNLSPISDLPHLINKETGYCKPWAYMITICFPRTSPHKVGRDAFFK